MIDKMKKVFAFHETEFTTQYHETLEDGWSLYFFEYFFYKIQRILFSFEIYSIFLNLSRNESFLHSRK